MTFDANGEWVGGSGVNVDLTLTVLESICKSPFTNVTDPILNKPPKKAFKKIHIFLKSSIKVLSKVLRGLRGFFKCFPGKKSYLGQDIAKICRSFLTNQEKD